MVDKPKSLKVRYPSYGKRVAAAMDKLGLTNEEVAKGLGQGRGEMVRRYRAGLARPDDDDTERKLATILGMSQSELRWGEKAIPGVKAAPQPKLTPDEQTLLQVYRKLLPVAQKVLRARATELLEELGAPDAENPFGNGRTKKPSKHSN